MLSASEKKDDVDTPPVFVPFVRFPLDVWEVRLTDDINIINPLISLS